MIGKHFTRGKKNKVQFTPPHFGEFLDELDQKLLALKLRSNDWTQEQINNFFKLKEIINKLDKTSNSKYKKVFEKEIIEILNYFKSQKTFLVVKDSNGKYQITKMDDNEYRQYIEKLIETPPIDKNYTEEELKLIEQQTGLWNDENPPLYISLVDSTELNNNNKDEIIEDKEYTNVLDLTPTLARK